MTELWAEPQGRRLENERMSIRTLPRATEKALDRARKTWPEARAEDFERSDKLWVDKASGVAYRRVPGDPFLGGAGRADVAVFFISADDAGDGILYLQRDGAAGSAVTEEWGEMAGRVATAREAQEMRR